MVMRTPRQWGKTEFLLDTALEWCLCDPGAQLWFVTPFYSQSYDIFYNKLWPRIAPNGVINRQIFREINRSILTIRFKNGSTWQFRSAQNFKGLRGPTLDYLICDEYAFFLEGVRQSVLQPMLMRKGKKAIWCSTPKGKEDFYELSMRCARSMPGWVEFRSDYEETGIPSLREFAESERPFTPVDVFQQEYEAEFIDGGGAVFRHIDRLFTLEDFAPPGIKHFAGIDLASTHDRTVVVIFNEQGQMVFFRRFEIAEQIDSEPLIDELAAILWRFPNTEAFVEVNFNRAILDALRGRHRLKKAYAFETTNKTKTEAIGKLIYAIDHHVISAPHLPVLKRELENFQVSHTEHHRLFKYSAPAGQHDDCVIALALANRLLINKTKLGVVSGAQHSAA